MQTSTFGLLLLLICSTLTVSAQNVRDDFEGGGTITGWVGDDCGMDNAFANPVATADNPSATVLRYHDTGGTYANVRFQIPTHFDLAQQSEFSLQVYVPSSGITGSQPNQVSLKLQDGNLAQPWTTQCEIVKPIVLDQWQTLTFDFASDPYTNLDPSSPAPLTRSDFSRCLLQVNGENNNDQVLAYFDGFLYDGATSSGGPVFNQLVWSDEFNGTGAIDTSKWYHQTQLPNGNSWYNGEVQHYTDRIENSFLDNGALHIMAQKETFTDQGHTKQYTSARLNSKFAFTYGRVEVRAKLPFGAGTWPAIWTLGKNISEPGGYWTPTFGSVGWPACGEIDIMEHWGDNQNFVQSALHTPSSFGGTINKGGIVATDVSNTWHVYALEWTADEMKFSMDGNVYYTYDPNPKDSQNWPFDADQYILLNVAMVGAIDPGFTQSPMVLDYIRVYQESTVSTEPGAPTGIQLYPNPVERQLNLNLPAGSGENSVKIFSLQGQLLDEHTTSDPKLSLDWSGRMPGMYLVEVENSGSKTAWKVIKL